MVKQLIREIRTDKRLRFIKWLWLGFISLLLLAIGTIVYLLISGIPSFQELENPKNNLASEILDVNGKMFGTYYVENRIPIQYAQLNPAILNALLATEDERFYTHSGIDFYALSRVAVKSLLLQNKDSGGGSTLTQQLAKQLFTRPNNKGKNKLFKMASLAQSKLKEWIIAVKLERSYTKEEIIAMYLNIFDFINGAHGIQSAAKIYFNKTQDQLNVQEAALLVSMLKNPSLYNPARFKQKATDRRNTVIALLAQKKYISKEKRDSLFAQPIDMSNFKKNEQSDGPAPYFRAELTKWINDIIKKNDLKKSDGQHYNIYTDGLKIHTTIDLTYQQYTEEASKEHMMWLQKRYFRQWKNMNPWTFEADDFQKKLRKESLISKAKSSDRYLNLRAKYLDKILATVAPDIKTSDNVIEILMSTDTNAARIKLLTENQNIEKSELEKYKAFKETETFKNIRAKYEELQIAFQKEYDKPVKMKVFDYEKGEVDTTMSPMDSVKFSAMHLQNAVMVVDPRNGHVRAWVGGIDHKHFKYDHVTSRRSVGSTMKPFVYTAAMAFGGVPPCQTYEDVPYTIAPGDGDFKVDKEWTPNNATEEFTGNQYNLYHGLLYSKNSITLRLLKEMGTTRLLRDLLDKVGISKTETLPGGRLAVPEFPSICLGAVDINLFHMTGAYTTFANKGTYREPIFVTKIEDKNGRVIYETNPVIRPAINPLYNSIMVDMLKNVVGGEFGMGLKSECAGKTGTTNDFSDGWFMGFTPSLVVGVWTGGDDKWIRFTNLNDGQGYVTARPVFQKLLRKLENDNSGLYDYKLRFPAPTPEFYELTNCNKYKTIRPGQERRNIINERSKKDEFEDEF